MCARTATRHFPARIIWPSESSVTRHVMLSRIGTRADIIVCTQRHRKTHEREEGGSDQPGLYNSEEDVEAEDQLVSLGEDDSPESDHNYLSGSITSMPMPMSSMGLSHTGLAAPSQLINATMLQQSV